MKGLHQDLSDAEPLGQATTHQQSLLANRDRLPREVSCAVESHGRPKRNPLAPLPPVIRLEIDGEELAVPTPQAVTAWDMFEEAKHGGSSKLHR